MKTINTFTGALDKDTSVLYQKNNTYTDAWNVRLITDEGGSNGALINLKGDVERVILPGSSSLINRPIGWAMIRKKLYLFCYTVKTNPVEIGGSIYEVTFDESTNASTVSLIYYSSELNFSLDYLIGEAVGRYETDTIQRLYWTDGLNPIRTINVVDPDISGLTPSDLNLNSSINLNPLLVDSVVQEGGNLVTGVYYYTYRLKGSDGQYTAYAPVIGPFNIIEESDEGHNYKEINGNDTTTEPVPVSSKYIKMSLDNEGPISYNIIEAVYIYQDSKEADLTINRFIERRVSQGNVNISHFGNETEELPVTLEEITGGTQSISTAETIAEKDNRLFIANITSQDTEIEAWDATVSRYNISGSSIKAKCGTKQVIDADNDDGKSIGYDYSANQFLYKYQSNFQTLGATGANISVSFKTIENVLDGTDSAITEIGGAGFRLGSGNTDAWTTRYLADGTSSVSIFGQDANKLSTTYSNPIKAGYLRGYQRGEFYRFGIIFYDLFGVPGFVKWVGDIKMPEAYDKDAGGTDGQCGLARQSIVGGTTPIDRKTIIYGKTLYPEFEVDVSDIYDRISGFSIVRVERDEDNKTIIAQGTVNPVASNVLGSSTLAGKLRPFPTGSGASIPKPFRCNLQNWTTHKSLRASAGLSAPGAGDAPKTNIATLDGPDTHFKAPVWKNGDIIRYISKTVAYGSGLDTHHYFMDDEHPLGGHRFGAWLYALSMEVFKPSTYGADGLANVFNIEKAVHCDTGEDKELYSTNFFYNSDVSDVNMSPTLAFKVSGDNSPDLQLDITDRNQRYLANYVRFIANQYGGNSADNLSQNDYITTGQFQKVDSPTSYTVPVLGGDTYINWYGYCKSLSREWLATGGSSAYGTYFQWFPVESTINTDLRRGNNLTSKIIGDAGGVGPYTNSDNLERLGEDFIYNDVFSSVNKTSIFKPRPIQSTISEIYDNRIYYTDEKINGNTYDDWSIIKLDDYYEVESKYGPLNRLEVNSDRMYAFQDRGISIIDVNPRALLSTETSDLVLGSGNIIDSIQYITTNSGSSHKFGVVSSDNYTYYVDVLQKKMRRISSQGIEDIKGVDGFLRSFMEGSIESSNALSDGSGIVLGYDPIYQEVLFTILNVPTSLSGSSTTVGGNSTIINSKTFNPYKRTLCFSEKVNAIVSNHSVTPYMYINTGNRILSPDSSSATNNPSSSLYEHNVGNYNKFRNKFYDSRLEYVVNDGSSETKTFDNMLFSTEVTKGSTNYNNITFNKIRCKNSYQNSDYVNLIYKDNIMNKDRGFALAVPRNVISKTYDSNIDITSGSNFDKTRTFKERLADKYMITELVFDNISNYRLLLHYIENYYRKNHR
jgi:hypothetical protein